MAANVANLIQGAGTLYYADFGETEPAGEDIASAPTGFTDVGATLGGVALRYVPNYAVLEADQIIDVAGRRLVGREFILVTQLAEPTLEHLVLAMNGEGSIATDAGPPATASWEPDAASAAVQPTYKAWIFDGFAEGADKRRRVIVRKGLVVAQFELAYRKDGQTVVPIEVHAHYVDASTKPFKILDET